MGPETPIPPAEPGREAALGRREPPMWLARLRWRARGENARAGFVVAVLVDALLLWALPISGEGAPAAGALLLAGFVNLVLLVAGGALGARVLRRRDPSLPRVVARDRAAASTMVVGAVLLCAGGILHRPTIDAQNDQVDRVAKAARTYAQAHAPASARTSDVDVRRYSRDLYRACVPVGRASDDRSWCAWVRLSSGGGVDPQADQDARPNDQVGGLLGPRPVTLR